MNCIQYHSHYHDPYVLAPDYGSRMENRPLLYFYKPSLRLISARKKTCPVSRVTRFVLATAYTHIATYYVSLRSWLFHYTQTHNNIQANANSNRFVCHSYNGIWSLPTDLTPRSIYDKLYDKPNPNLQVLQVKTFYSQDTNMLRSRDSAVGTATGYGLDDRGVWVQVPVGSRIYSTSRPSEDHLTSYPTGTSGSFQGVKRRGGEADHSPPTSVEVRKMLIYTSNPPHTPSWRSA
jgi:hypothetical protein